MINAALPSPALQLVESRNRALKTIRRANKILRNAKTISEMSTPIKKLLAYQAVEKTKIRSSGYTTVLFILSAAWANTRSKELGRPIRRVTEDQEVTDLKDDIEKLISNITIDECLKMNQIYSEIRNLAITGILLKFIYAKIRHEGFGWETEGLQELMRCIRMHERFTASSKRTAASPEGAEMLQAEKEDWINSVLGIERTDIIRWEARRKKRDAEEAMLRQEDGSTPKKRFKET